MSFSTTAVSFAMVSMSFAMSGVLAAVVGVAGVAGVVVSADPEVVGGAVGAGRAFAVDDEGIGAGGLGGASVDAD